MYQNFGGVFRGVVLSQDSISFGGSRNVFVKLQGDKDDLVFPTFGGQLKNPFPGIAKIYAGDLMEFRTDAKGESGEVYLLKTYEVAKATSDTTVLIKRDGYRHIPFVGDILMKEPATMATAGAAYTVTAVEETTDSGADVWKLTLNTALGSLIAGDVLVEADKEHATDAKMLVQNINAVAPNDFDVFNMPSSGKTTDFDKARYFMLPALAGTMWKHMMSPVPKCCDVYNVANINGWFRVDGRINRVRE